MGEYFIKIQNLYKKTQVMIYLISSLWTTIYTFLELSV